MHGVNEYKKGSKMTNPGILFLGLFFGFFLSLFLVHSSSAINQQISFQGKLTDATGNLVTDGVHYLKFSLYDTASIGTCQYTAAGSCGSVTTTPVTVTGGIFSVNLGDTDSGINALPATLFNADALYLGLTVCSGPNTGCDTEMTPRKRVTASPYAFNSKKLDGVGINTVSSSLYLPVSDAVGNFNFNSVTSTGLLSVKYSNNDTLQQWLDGSGNVIGSFATSTGSVILPAVGTNGNNYSYIQNAVFSLGDSSHSGALKLNGTAADAGGSVLFTYPGSSLIKTYLDGNGLVVGGDDTTSTFGGIEIIHASTLSNPSGLFHVGGDGSVSTSGTLSVFGNLSRINNVPYSWTGSQGGANTFLRNDGSGSLTWATVVGGSGTNDWGRFGTTYGALALMTSSTYPVWFDGAVYTSSSVKIAGGSKSYLDIGGDGNGLGQLYIQASSTTAVPLLIRANANQGSNTAITSWQDGLGRTMMQFTSSSNNGWELNIGNNNGGLGGQVRLTDPTDNFSLFSSNRFALNRSNAGLYDQGVFNIDYLGNTSVSGTLSVFGNLSRINNVPYSWTGSQGGANTFLRNDGSGSLTWATVVGGSGTNDWGRFGTTYGALALMTSSTYPVWFDGAVYSSSSLYVGGGNSLSGLSITAGSNNDGDKLLSILDHGGFNIFSLATSSGSGGPKGTVLNLGNKDVSDGEGVILLHGGGALVVADQSETYSNVELGVQNNTQGYLRLVNNGTGVTSTLTADALMLGVTTDVNEEIVDNGKFFVYATTGNISTSGTIQSFMPTGVGTTIYAQKWFDIGGNELASLSTTTLGGDFVNLSVGNTALNSSGRLVLKQGSSLYPPQVKVEGATALSYGLLSPSQLTINDGIASGFLNPSAVVVNNGTYFSNLSPQSLTVGGFGTTGGVFEVNSVGSLSASGTLKFYGAATLLDALIATSNTSSLRSIKLSSLTSAPDSSAGNIYFDSGVGKFYGYTSAGNVVDLGATGSGVNDWGRFGTTYGALALMTSSTYPVWFDGAIFASSTMNLSNNLTIDRNSYAINDGSPAFVLISGTPSTLDGQYSALALGSASSTNASINGKLWSLSSNSEGGAATTVFALSFSDDATAYSATPMMVTEAGNISLTTTTISTLLSVGTGSNFSYLYPTSLTISRDTGRETGVFYVNGAGEVFASNTLSVNLGSPSSAGLVVKGNALQTGNLLDLKNDLGNSLFSVASSSIFGAPVVDFSVGGAGKLAYVSLKGSGDIGGNAPVFQLMDPSNSYARLSMSTIQTGGSLFTIGTGLATSTFTPTSLRLGQTDVSPYQVGDTGRIFLDGITGSLSASGTLKFYGAATLLDALIATSNTSSLRSIKLSSLTSAPDSSAGNIYFDSGVGKFYGYTSAGNVVDLGATGSGVNDWGRFGTTYGALALMTSSTYPVWFDGAVYTSSSVKIAGGLNSYLDIGGDGNGLGQLYIQASSTSAKPLIIRANANQVSTSYLTDWQNSSGLSIGSFSSSSAFLGVNVGVSSAFLSIGNTGSRGVLELKGSGNNGNSSAFFMTDKKNTYYDVVLSNDSGRYLKLGKGTATSTFSYNSLRLGQTYSPANVIGDTGLIFLDGTTGNIFASGTLNIFGGGIAGNSAILTVASSTGVGLNGANGEKVNYTEQSLLTLGDNVGHSGFVDLKDGYLVISSNDQPKVQLTAPSSNFLYSGLVMGDGSSTSSLRHNSFSLGISNNYNLGNFLVDSLGSISASGTLHMFATSTLYNVIPDMVGSTGNVSLYNLGASTTRWSNVWAENVNIGTSTWSLNQGANGRLSFLNGLGGSEIFSIARDGQVVNNGGAYTSGVAQTAASYGTNILTNGSLDAWTGSVPDGWTEINPGGGSGIISQENTIVHTALGSAIKNAAAADGAKVDYQTISGLTPGASYELKLWGYVATGASGAIGSIIIVDGSFGVDANYVWVNATQSWDAIVGGNPSPGILSINTLEDTWEQLAVIVTVPASGKISIILNNTASGVGKLAYFDDVSLRSYTPAAVVTAFNFNTQSTIGASSYLLNVKNNGTSAMSLTGSGLTVAGGISLTGGVSTASNLTFSSSSVNRINFATTTLFYSSNNSASTPTFIFDTANNISNSHVISIRNQGTPIFSIAPNGDVRALGNLYSFSSVVGTPGNPGDLAERVDVLPEEMVEAGDLMMVDYKNNDTYRKTTSSYEGKISGVISTNPTITVGDGKTSSTAVMALSGRVPLKVSEENGPIRKGDYLVSSNQPGVAMKATEPGMVVGMALEDFVTPTSSPIGKILTFVSPRFTIGTINADGTLEILSSENKPQEDGLLDGFSRTIKNSLKKLGIIVYEGITKVKELFADKVTTDRLCVGTTCVDEETLKTLLQKNSVAPTSAPASTPEPTVEPVVEPTPEITPTPESTPAPEVVAPDPNPTPTPEPTPAPEVVTPEPTPAPAN